MEQLPNLESVALFIRVVEAGSFAKVSRAYGIPKASLSRKVSQLEELYGAQLLIRSTRRLQLSEIGREVYGKVHSMLALYEETRAAVSKTKQKPHGTLRISAGVEYGVSVLSPIVNEFLRRFPDVNVELDLTGRKVDLIYESYDLGVRIGPLENSTLAARKIGSFKYGLFVGQKFYAENKPVGLDKIRDLPTMGFTRTNNNKFWMLVHSTQQNKLEINPRFSSNNYWTILSAVIANLGIAFMPIFLVQEELRRKSILQIHPNWSSEDIPIHFIYPSQKYLNSKVRTFIDFAISKLK